MSCRGLLLVVGAVLPAFAAVNIDRTPLPPATVGTAYLATLTANGGKAPYEWAVVPQPPWMNVSSAGQISGTPDSAGQVAFVAGVRDSEGGADLQSFTIDVAAAPAITTTTLPDATLGSTYSATLNSTGGSAPITWSATGLPGGLQVSNAGVVAGTPQAPGAFHLAVSLLDAAGATASAAVGLKVTTPLAITTATLPGGMMGTAYSASVAAEGGAPPYAWSLEAGTLPAGLTLATDGTITGTPAAAGTSSFTVRVQDASGAFATKQLSIAVTSNLTITTTTLPAGVTGSPYSAALAATGGTGSYTWSISAGALPPGLTLANTGEISGTPTAAGTANFTATVNDGSATASKALSIAVSAPPLTIATTTLPDAVSGTPYSATLAASGGSGSYAWSVTSGTLPAGLALAAGGQISGTPTTAGASTFTATVSDGTSTASKSLSLTVAPPPLAVTSSVPPDGVVGSPYTATLTASGGTGNYSWSVTSGSLPAGLSLSPTGQISGSPTTAGASTFTLTVNDGVSTASKAFTITIAAPALAISTSSLPDGVTGTAYTATLTATGGTGSYTWSVASGTLPAGLALSPAGQISGTPTTTGTTDFAVTVTDTANATATKALSIRINAPALAISTTSLPDGIAGTAYSATLAATGGTGAYTWSITAGQLPAGLTLSPTGQISGTPTQAGTAEFTVTVTDAANATAAKALSIRISAPALTITTTTLPEGTAGSPYTASLAATGGSPPLTWSITAGALPGGLSMDNNGQITGTPTAAGTSAFTVRVADSASGTATKQLSIVIAPPAVAVSTTSLPSATVASPYTASLAATGGTTPYTWSVSTGALPAGLALSPTGQISGTATAPGTASFTVAVADANHVNATAPLSITVNATALSITTPSLPSGITGTAYAAPVSASGGTPPYTWSVTSGALPPGLSLSGAQIAGTPTSAGSFNFGIRATDTRGVTADASLSIRIFDALAVQLCPTPAAVVGQPYSSAATGSGGVTPYTWAISTGQLPPGIDLNTASGAFTGTPTQSGGFTFTVRLTDATSNAVTRACGINVTPALALAAASLPGGVTGSAYSYTFKATGGTTPYTWVVVSGSLPPGLALNPDTGTVSGTLRQEGNYSFRIRVTDGSGAHAESDFQIAVTSGLTITSCPAPAAALGIPYLGPLGASGGTTPYTWSATGAMPPGIQVNGGSLQGTPTQLGTFTFTLRVVDAGGVSRSRDCTLQVANPLTITTRQLPGGGVGASYSQTVAATGGTPPYSWSTAAGALPPGLALNAATGQITGTPSAPGSFSFTVRVADANQVTADADLAIAVTAGFEITSCPVPAATIGQAYSGVANAAGGQPPYSWSIVSGALPAGLSLAASTGAVSGTPSQIGANAFTLRATDSSGAVASRACSIAVNPTALTITNSGTLPDAPLGVAYTATLEATGGRAPYTWNIIDGSLPPGITLSGSGVVSGTPTTAGAYTFTVRVTDADRNVSSQVLRLTATPGPTPTVRFTGIQPIADPAQQMFVGLTLDSSYPVDISGTLNIRFDADPGLTDDPAVQFAGGGRSVAFTVPANTTTAVFANAANGLQTGTVAGTIHFEATLNAAGLDITPSPAPAADMRVDRLAPRITALAVTRTTGGIEARITAFSTTREVTSATFRFTPAPGSNVQQAEFTVPLTDAARQWFADPRSAEYGSQFVLVEPFTIQGASVNGLSVTLTNGQGTSAASTATF